MSINPWIIVGLLVAFIATAAGGYTKGRLDGAAKCEERISALQKDSQTRKDNEAAKGNKAATGLEKDKANAQVIYRDRDVIVTKIIERPIYRNVCLDTDGLSAANAALAGSTGTPGKSDKPMP